MRVLLLGGTGVLGREFQAVPRVRGQVLRVQSRRDRPPGVDPAIEWARADLESGEGLAEAMTGVQTVVHSATDPKRTAQVDVAGTARLMAAANQAGVSHLLYVSIIGIDRIPLGYYKAKVEAEKLVTAGGVPWSILRATQFHSLIEMFIRKAARFPLVMPLAKDLRFQGVDESEVAVRLVRAVNEGPGEYLLEFGGPEVKTLGEYAVTWKEITGTRKPVLPLRIPGRVAAGFREGRNTNPAAEKGRITWREWLVRRRPES
jgi:uncharacterized protein YbjT (DUF2867 family)